MSRIGLTAIGIGALLVVLVASAFDQTDSPTSPGHISFHYTDSIGNGSYHTVHPHSGQLDETTDPGIHIDRGAQEIGGRTAVVPCNPESLQTSGTLDHNQAICRIDLTDGTRELVVDTGSPARHPSPSPDGASVVFASGADADHGLKVIPSAGGEVRSLCSGFCPLFRFFDIAWSPDGNTVAFVATTPGSAGHTPQIYAVTVGESDYTQLTNSPGAKLDPAWSPDGNRLAYSSTDSGDTELWVMNADGSGLIQLTSRPGLDVEPTWSPDGNHIAYARHINGTWDLAMIPASGGEPTPLSNLPGSETTPVWLPGATG